MARHIPRMNAGLEGAQSEVIRAILLEDSPCCGFPHHALILGMTIAETMFITVPMKR